MSEKHLLSQVSNDVVKDRRYNVVVGPRSNQHNIMPVNPSNCSTTSACMSIANVLLRSGGCGIEYRLFLAKASAEAKPDMQKYVCLFRCCGFDIFAR